MSTKFDVQQLLTFAIKAGLTDAYEAAKIVQFAPIDPDALRGRPDLEQQKKYYDDRLANLASHPTVQRAIHAAPAPTLSTQQHQPASVARAAIHAAMRNPGQQVQAPQLVQRSHGRQVVAHVQQQPDPSLKAAVNGLNQAVKEMGDRLEAIVRRSVAQQRKAKKQASTQKAAVQQQPAQPQQPTPQLPISPYTGQPSQIRAAVLKSMGEQQPALNQHPYQVEQQRQYQAMQQQAQHEAGLSVSPFTGKPSELTTMIRAQYGLK